MSRSEPAKKKPRVVGPALPLPEPPQAKSFGTRFKKKSNVEAALPIGDDPVQHAQEPAASKNDDKKKTLNQVVEGLLQLAPG